MKSLPEIFKQFDMLNVLIIGDVMIDSYLWGKVERISPEAPVPVVNVQKREIRLGGAANVALNIQALGANPILCSVIGNDQDGKNLLELIQKHDMSNAGIVLSKDRITTIKHRIISGGHHMLRVDQETDKEINDAEKQALLEKILALLPTVHVIIFEDYDKGVLNETIIQKVIAAAKSKGIPTVVDPKKRNFLAYKEATLFKPNKKELKEGIKTDKDLNNLQDLDAAVAQLKSILQADKILITLSEQGVFINDGTEKLHFPAHLRNIADVSGAGDTVVSTAALALALQLPSSLIAQLSNLAGGLVCEEVGVVPIQKQKLLDEAIRLGLKA